jgi:hypothetical protein
LRGVVGTRASAVRGGERGRAETASQPGDWLTRNALRIIEARSLWLPIGVGRPWRGSRSSGRSALRTSWRVVASAERWATGGLGARRLRPAVARASCTDSRRCACPRGEAGAGRALACRPGPRGRGDGAPLGAVRAPRRRLERGERCEMWHEARLRAAELETERAIASAQLGTLPDGRPRLRRPDLVLFPPMRHLSPSRSSCRSRGRGSAARGVRCRIVSEVRYYAPRPVAPAVPVPFRRSGPTTPSRSCPWRKP